MQTTYSGFEFTFEVQIEGTYNGFAFRLFIKATGISLYSIIVGLLVSPFVYLRFVTCFSCFDEKNAKYFGIRRFFL